MGKKTPRTGVYPAPCSGSYNFYKDLFLHAFPCAVPFAPYFFPHDRREGTLRRNGSAVLVSNPCRELLIEPLPLEIAEANIVARISPPQVSVLI